MSLWRIIFAVSTNEDWVDSIAVETSDDTPVPYDFTGSSFEMQLRTAPEVLKIVLELNGANGRLAIQDPPTDGKIAIYVDKETVAAALKPGTYFYDILWTQPDGRVVNFITGSVGVSLGVTRDDT